MNETVDPESRRALAFTVEPSGAMTRTRQVINRTFELILVVAALDVDATDSVFGSWTVLGLLDIACWELTVVSWGWCSSVWCNFWHFWQWFNDRQFLAKCSEPRQFKHKLLLFKILNLRSRLKDLNWLQTYNGCFSLQTTQEWSVTLLVKEVNWGLWPPDPWLLGFFKEWASFL